VNAWGPHHMLGYLKVFGTFQADELWVMGPVCDVTRPRYGLEAVPFFSSKNKPWCALQEALNHGMWRFGRGGAAETPGDAARQGIEAYRQIIALAGRSGIPARIFFLPDKEENRNRRVAMSPELRESLQADVEILFLEDRSKELYWDGFHLNPEGHAVYARTLAAFLEQRRAGR
jgi:lysophospholipase L1-like esterase